MTQSANLAHAANAFSRAVEARIIGDENFARDFIDSLKRNGDERDLTRLNATAAGTPGEDGKIPQVSVGAAFNVALHRAGIYADALRGLPEGEALARSFLPAGARTEKNFEVAARIDPSFARLLCRTGPARCDERGNKI